MSGLDGAKQQEKKEGLDAYTWWHLTGKTPPFLFKGLDVFLDSIAQTILKQDSSDGVIRFSQGAALAAMVASLLENNCKDFFDNRG
jgi:dihydrofolate reductase